MGREQQVCRAEDASFHGKAVQPQSLLGGSVP